VELLGVDAAGLMLSDQRGGLGVLASSSAQTRALEVFQLQVDQGPCLECFETGEPVSAVTMAEQAQRWPQFAAAAHAHGFAAVDALPLRLREEVIGALNLFRTNSGHLPSPDLQVAQALADTATIGILQERAIHHSGTLVEQLQAALESRVAIEQAKGIIAERGGISTAEAFTRLRAHARSHNTRLSPLATAVAARDLDPDIILTTTPQRTPRPATALRRPTSA
jgi:transcriptional regulator with GAF, ATPase, and Fis domain